MVVFPGAKINLGLEVLRKRPDGFHDIRSILYPIPLHDVLEVIVDPAVPAGELRMERSGLCIPGNAQDDLCAKAVRAFSGADPLPGLRAHLHKVIPIGAGLGGGSSDAAAMLRSLGALFPERHTEGSLFAIATGLGSDVPFFLMDGPCLATGRGELLSPVPYHLRGKWLLLANPGIHIPTPSVYANTTPEPVEIDLERALAEGNWQAIRNRMEEYVFSTYPAVAALHGLVSEQGALFSAMSGSGSSVFGLFDHEPEPVPLPSDMRQWILRL